MILLLAFALTALGWPAARRLLPPSLPPLAFAPMLGWAIHTAISGATLPWLGFAPWMVAALFAVPFILVWAWHLRAASLPLAAGLSPWSIPGAAALALLPMAGVLPKHVAGGVRLAAPIFDHSKIAIVDAIVRQGMPPSNPFYGGAAGSHLAYYYWWHLGAAEWSRLTGASGWTADAGLTWFTAFATLLLLAGLAEALDRRAGIVAMALALAASLRPLLTPLERPGWLLTGSGLGGWLNQASWAPQHLAAAGGLILAALLLAQLAEAPGLAGMLALGAVLAASFGSSAWVGGIVLAVGGPLAALSLAARMPARRRLPVLAAAAAAAVVAAALAFGLIHTEAAARAKLGALPVALSVYPVFGNAGPWLNVSGFPLLMLIEFPVAAVLGTLGSVRSQRAGAPPWQGAMLAMGAAGLAICCCLRSTIMNNDLGWRAILPALLALLPFAAAEARHRWRAGGTHLILAALPLLGFAGTWPLLRENLLGHAEPGEAAFAREAALWRSVRGITGPADRIAGDPRLDAGMTLWPANIGWALLADRPSCYSGWATAFPFAAIDASALYATAEQIRRVFDGAPAPGDLEGLATRLHCQYVLLTTASVAWRQDPFAAQPGFSAAGSGPDWRLYRLSGAKTP